MANGANPKRASYPDGGETPLCDFLGLGLAANILERGEVL